MTKTDVNLETKTDILQYTINHLNTNDLLDHTQTAQSLRTQMLDAA